VHLGHDVHVVNDERRARGQAKSDMQNGTVLGDVDVLALEHGVATGFEA